jgi:hypothetical protein
MDVVERLEEVRPFNPHFHDFRSIEPGEGDGAPASCFWTRNLARPS